tara:strand:- start:921 stop:1199 length:279 start_codon:yes stop_codon:yes gene_type:complete
MSLKYKQVPYKENQFALEFIDHEFSGIKFVLGKVQLNENNLTLKYHYDIIESSGKDFDEDKFQTAIGDLLMQMLDDGVKRNDLVYYGGIDEN